jgi:hypothetical protein
MSRQECTTCDVVAARTQVTDQGVKNLGQALPNCKIAH